MRDTVDCAVLMVPEHAGWMREWMDRNEGQLGRVRLYAVGLDGGQHAAQQARETPSPASRQVDAQALLRAAMALRRYDCCILPVTSSSLAWTRTALACAREQLLTPMLALARDLKAAAVQDLLGLGLHDFVRVPVCPEELRARVARLRRSVPAVPGAAEVPGYAGSLPWTAEADAAGAPPPGLAGAAWGEVLPSLPTPMIDGASFAATEGWLSVAAQAGGMQPGAHTSGWTMGYSSAGGVPALETDGGANALAATRTGAGAGAAVGLTGSRLDGAVPGVGQNGPPVPRCGAHEAAARSAALHDPRGSLPPVNGAAPGCGGAMPRSLREPATAYGGGRPRLPQAVIDQALLSMQAAARIHPDEPFRQAKSRVVASFERDYVRTALSRHSGNVARAARASAKHRRAFWALMRKHHIDAGPYRLRKSGEGCAGG